MLIRDFIEGPENSIVNKGNIDRFYRYINRKFSFKSVISPLKRSNGSVTTNPVLKAELLKSVFQSKFNVDNGVSPPNQNIPEVGKLSLIVFSSPLIELSIKCYPEPRVALTRYHCSSRISVTSSVFHCPSCSNYLSISATFLQYG
jgi:hypothetical protein